MEEIMRFLGLYKSPEQSQTHALVERLLHKRERLLILSKSIADIEAELNRRGVSVDPQKL